MRISHRAINKKTNIMKRSFIQYTDRELLTLDNETINDAIRIEAIERGVQPPITLSDAIRKSEWRGYKQPVESMTVFEIVTKKDSYSNNSSGVGYLDEAKAIAALDGMIEIEEVNYGANQGTKIHQCVAVIQRKFVGIQSDKQAWAKFEEFTQDTEKFEAVKTECIERLSKVRQDDYNRRVNEEKKVEYLRLAGGNEEIAKGFWAKVEKVEWPVQISDVVGVEPAPAMEEKVVTS